jgi:hypothetical protein
VLVEDVYRATRDPVHPLWPEFSWQISTVSWPNAELSNIPVDAEFAGTVGVRQKKSVTPPRASSTIAGSAGAPVTGAVGAG